MTEIKSKSEMKRIATLDPMKAAEELAALRAKLAIAVEALEFYSSPYKYPPYNPGIKASLTPAILMDHGDIAREALARIKGGGD